MDISSNEEQYKFNDFLMGHLDFINERPGNSFSNGCELKLITFEEIIVINVMYDVKSRESPDVFHSKRKIPDGHWVLTGRY